MLGVVSGVCRAAVFGVFLVLVGVVVVVLVLSFVVVFVVVVVVVVDDDDLVKLPNTAPQVSSSASTINQGLWGGTQCPSGIKSSITRIHPLSS